MDAHLISIVAAAVSSFASVVAALASKAKAHARAVDVNATSVEQLQKWLVELKQKHDRVEGELAESREKLHEALVTQGEQNSKIEELNARVGDLEYQVSILREEKDRAVVALTRAQEKIRALEQENAQLRQSSIVELKRRTS